MKGDRVLRRHGGREKWEGVVGGFNSNAKDNSGTIQRYLKDNLLWAYSNTTQCSGRVCFKISVQIANKVM